MSKEKPISPHLQVYKWQFSSLLSITHRLTSIFNIFGILFFVLWLVSIFIGKDCYQYFEIISKTFLARFLFVGFTWSFSYHLLNGIRHLAWDLGFGYEMKTANFTGVTVLISSFILTILVWI